MPTEFRTCGSGIMPQFRAIHEKEGQTKRHTNQLVENKKIIDKFKTNPNL